MMIESGICTARLLSEMGVGTMNKREQTVCFTGHRQIGEAVAKVEDRVTEIAERLIQEGYSCFCAGGARGFDTLAAMVILRLQEKYPLVRLVLVLPFWNQYRHETGWTAEDIAEYHRLRAAASEVIHLQQNYSRGCYYKRNRYLVDMSSVCVAYQRSETGGTAYTVRYATEKGLQIINCAAI